MPASDFYPIFVDLTKCYPDLIFWKHFERGIAGEGDIDSIAPLDLVNEISSSFVNAVIERIENIVGIVECRYGDNTRAHFVVLKSEFPKLFQFDIAWAPRRYGVTWCDIKVLAKFSYINEMGIRVLKPAALSIVLLMLYGISWRGRNFMKSHDYQDLLIGLRTEKEIAHQFIDAVIINELRAPLHNIVNQLQMNTWCKGLIRETSRAIACKLIRDCFSNGPQHYVSLMLPLYRKLINKQKYEHHHSRIAVQSSIEHYFAEMANKHHKISRKNEIS